MPFHLRENAGNAAKKKITEHLHFHLRTVIPMADSLLAVRAKYPTLSPHTELLATLASQKQIHQLTKEIVRFLDVAQSVMPASELVEFFNTFVSKYTARVNPLQLVGIIRKCTMGAGVDTSVCVSLLNQYESQISASKDAVISGKVLRAEQFLRKSQDLSSTRTEVDGIESLLKDPNWAHVVSNPIRGSYHLVAADMYLAMGSNDLDFYKHLVKFLTYTPLSEISQEVVARTTKQAGVIALINPEINDFGDILSLQAFNETLSPATPVWVIDFLRAIHLGDFDKFDSAVANHSAFLRSNESALMNQIDSSLRRKLVMIALAELAAFKTPEKNRRLKFEEIASVCRVPIEQVETLIMTTMGTGGLIEGVIDEVDSSVIVTSVKPRILDTARVLLLKNRIENWANRAQDLLVQMKDTTPELMAN